MGQNDFTHIASHIYRCVLIGHLKEKICNADAFYGIMMSYFDFNII